MKQFNKHFFSYADIFPIEIEKLWGDLSQLIPEEKESIDKHLNAG